MKRTLVAAAGLLALACTRASSTAVTPPPGAVAQARSLAEQGKLDEALLQLQALPPDADGLCEQGRIWARRAQSAPVPTPPPLASAPPPGAGPPRVAEFKPEELRAAELYQQAVALRADHSCSRLGLAELLGPHALRWHERQREAAARRRPARRGREEPSPPAAIDAGLDYSVDRVVREYQAAVTGDPTSRPAVEALIAFATRVGRLGAAEAGYQELLRQVKEKPEPYVRYGDFLAREKRDADAAVEQYTQALIWRPDDEATRQKVAEIHLARGIEHWGRQEYLLADQRLREAAKYVTDRSSDLGRRLDSYQTRLRAIRR